MNNKVNAIILHIVKYSDNYNIAEIYTRELGKLSIRVKNKQGTKSAILSTNFQPLSIMEIELIGKKETQLPLLKEAHAKQIMNGIYCDIYKSAIALYISELLLYTLREEGMNYHLYDYITASINRLNKAERKKVANFHLVFQRQLSYFMGIYPNIESYEEGKWFDMIAGEFTTEKPTHSHYIPPYKAQHIPLLGKMNYRNMHLYHLNRKNRRDILEEWNNYFRIHIPGFPELKSKDVLQSLFD